MTGSRSARAPACSCQQQRWLSKRVATRQDSAVQLDIYPAMLMLISTGVAYDTVVAECMLSADNVTAALTRVLDAGRQDMQAHASCAQRAQCGALRPPWYH